MIIKIKHTFVFLIIAVFLLNSYSSLALEDVVDYNPIRNVGGFTKFDKNDKGNCRIDDILLNSFKDFPCSIIMNVDDSYFTVKIRGYNYVHIKNFAGKRYQSSESNGMDLHFPFTSLTRFGAYKTSDYSTSIVEYTFRVQSIDSSLSIKVHVEADAIDSNYFYYVNNNRLKYVNYLRKNKEKINTLTQSLTNTYASIKNAENDVQSEIREANTEIINISNKITSCESNRNSLQITNKTIQDSITKLNEDKLEKENNYNNCISDSTTISKKLEIYKKYGADYNEEVEFNYLNKVTDSFCSLNSNITKIASLLPQYSYIIYQLKKAFYKNYDVKDVNGQLTSNKFYIFNELD